MVCDESFFGYGRSDFAPVGLRENYEKKLKNIQRVGDTLDRVSRQVGPLAYNGKFIDARERLYKVASVEARQAALGWLERGFIQRGHVNEMKGKNGNVEEI